LVIEISLYYDARSKKHQITSIIFTRQKHVSYFTEFPRKFKLSHKCAFVYGDIKKTTGDTGTYFCNIYFFFFAIQINTIEIYILYCVFLNIFFNFNIVF